MPNLACAGLMIVAVVATGEPLRAERVTQSDEQWYTEGSYLPYASPWCRMIDKTLQQGRDYNDQIMFDRGTVPKDMIFNWRWPDASKARSPACGVYGYDYLAWGNYAGGNVQQAVEPRQVRTIKSLAIRYEVGPITGTESFDGLIEFFLTRAKGDAASNVIEIGWFFHAPPYTMAFVRGGKPLGLYKDTRGLAWLVTRTISGAAEGFISFAPPDGTDRPNGRIDAKAAFDWLVNRKLIAADLWFNGMALGAEPLGGAGSMVVRNLEVSYR